MKKKIILIFILIITAFASLLFIVSGKRLNDNRTALIYCDGKLIKSIELDNLSEAVEFEVVSDDGHVNTILAEKGRVCMKYADCPDKVCVNQGWIDDGRVPVVCMPNKVIIKIEDAENYIDAYN